MSVFRIIFTVIVVLVIAFVGWFGFNRSTKYCPWKHRLSGTASCVVLDEDKKAVLLQHFDLDTNRGYLEIRDQSGSHLFRFPPTIKKLAPEGYTAHFVSGTTIRLDGKLYQLDSISNRTW